MRLNSQYSVNWCKSRGEELASSRRMGVHLRVRFDTLTARRLHKIAVIIEKGTDMSEKTEYAISYAAIKFYENGGADISNGIHIILATDEKSAELDAMKMSLERCRPIDGYIVHVAAATKIFTNDSPVTTEGEMGKIREQIALERRKVAVLRNWIGNVLSMADFEIDEELQNLLSEK